MKGNEKLIDKLNFLLTSELTAINQYIVHAEMCENWGFSKLHKIYEKRAIVEMRHAEKLIGRILFMEGIPIVSNLNKINIGADIASQLAKDWTAEYEAIKDYNDAIALAAEVKDHATRDILIEILNDEDKHIDEIEELKDQIEMMTLPVFLGTQTE